MNKKKICALATGLEANEQAFVWSIKHSQTELKPKATEVGIRRENPR